MPANSNETGSHLTVSRINRLLRPLRNKCANLNNLSGQVHINPPRRPSSTSISTWDTESPPLTTDESTGFDKKYKSDRGIILADYELKRRIRAVCDAFRNVVYGAFGTPYTERIPSLADMCSSVIGNNVPVTTTDLLGTDSEAESVDEDDIIAVADEIYESIPSHFRRFSVVSHALSTILHSCSRYHALINILLDICLSFRLVCDAQHLLSIILSQAFIPSDSASLPPITHPAHATYLVDLHARWTNMIQSQSAQHNPSPFTTSTFCRAVLSTLSHSGDHAVFGWSEVDKLGHTVGHQDIDSFAHLIDALATFLTLGESRTPRSRNSGAMEEGTRLCKLHTQLRDWMILLWEDLSPNWESSGSLFDETLPLLIDILGKCHNAGFADNISSAGHTHPRLPDITAVLATQILVYFEAFDDQLISILQSVPPIPTTYSTLVEYLCRRPSEERNFVEHLMLQLERYSFILRSRNLLKLDASLWACTLSHFEKTTNLQGSATFISRLVDAVDAAEKRCFGQTQHDSSPPVTLPSRFKRGNKGHRRKSSGHWEWEEMVECWIRQTPIPKTRKLSYDNQPTSRSVREDGQVRKFVKFASRPQRARVTSRRSLGSATYECFDPDRQLTDSGSECQSDKENLEHSPSRRQLSLKKPRINFSTLLADAQTNRIDLHSNNGSSKIMIPGAGVVPSTATQRLSLPVAQPLRSPMLSPRLFEYPTLHSDDSLDLFAASSPAR